MKSKKLHPLGYCHGVKKYSTICLEDKRFRFHGNLSPAVVFNLHFLSYLATYVKKLKSLKKKRNREMRRDEKNKSSSEWENM